MIARIERSTLACAFLNRAATLSESVTGWLPYRLADGSLIGLEAE